MAYIYYNKLWESEFDNIVPTADRVQVMNFNQLKLQVHDTYRKGTYRKDEKITTNFETTDNEDVINKACLDENFLEIDGQLSFLENDYNEFELQYNKQSVEEISFQRVVKTTKKVLYDKGLFDSFPNADKVSQNFLFVTRQRSDFEESKWSHSVILFIKKN